MWANVAGDCLHLVQVGSTEGYIFASMALERWSLCITLNWIRLCLIQIDDPWILYIASFHSTSVRRILRSSCQESLSAVIEVDNNDASFVCKSEMVPLCTGLLRKKLINRVLFRKWRKRGKIIACEIAHL